MPAWLLLCIISFGDTHIDYCDEENEDALQQSGAIHCGLQRRSLAVMSTFATNTMLTEEEDGIGICRFYVHVEC